MPSPRRAGPSRQPAVDELLFQVKACGLPTPEREVPFHPSRKWRFDLLFGDRVFDVGQPQSLAVEVDGGGFVNGRHGRGKGIEQDCEKYAEAMLLGFRVLRVTPNQVKSGRALQWITELVKAK